jgi:hypothetical protein
MPEEKEIKKHNYIMPQSLNIFLKKNSLSRPKKKRTGFRILEQN